MKLCIILLFFLCVLQFCYIWNVKKQLRTWLSTLQSIKNAPQQKLFTKEEGLLGDTAFALNEILAENQKQLLQLKRSEEANKHILTNLSHDVRTPLTSLIGYLEAIDNNRTDEVQEYTHVAYRKAMDLKEFIDMLFEWFKLDANEQQYRMEDCDVNELTREIIIEWLPLLHQNQISLAVDISDEEWFLRLDRMAYKRILNNLMQNAVHHGKCSCMEIRIQQKAGNVEIAVSNNGIAIPQDKLPYVFERLYKCDTARSDYGNGLGLAIAKELAAAMSGEISVNSIPENNTTFIIVLPIPV